IDYQDEAAAMRRRYIKDAELSGNSPDDIHADWHDYELADVRNQEELRERALHALEMVDLSEDVYRFGLRSTIDPDKAPETAELVLAARRLLFSKVEAGPSLKNMIGAFDQDTYHANATVAGNLLFGTRVGDAFDLDRMAENP